MSTTGQYVGIKRNKLKRDQQTRLDRFIRDTFLVGPKSFNDEKGRKAAQEVLGFPVTITNVFNSRLRQRLVKNAFPGDVVYLQAKAVENVQKTHKTNGEGTQKEEIKETTLNELVKKAKELEKQSTELVKEMKKFSKKLTRMYSIS